jgi:hypothetical protein
MFTLAIALVASACQYAPLMALMPQPEDEVTVRSTEDGAKYIHVASSKPTSPGILRNRWKREARKTCRGDYMVIAEDKSERLRQGTATNRTHEGYVRCIDPEATMDDGTDKSEPDAQPSKATAKSPAKTWASSR